MVGANSKIFSNHALTFANPIEGSALREATAQFNRLQPTD